MRLLQVSLALVVLVGWSVSADAAGKGKGKGKKGAKPVNGVVVSVKQDEGKDTGTLTVQVTAHKKKGQANTNPPVEKSFQISASTKFTNVEKVKGQKGQTQESPATLAGVKKGDRITVQATGDLASDVKIHLGKKKK